MSKPVLVYTGALLLLMMSASANARYQFTVTNKCHLPLKLALQYHDAIEGQWKIESWYRIAPGTTGNLTNASGRKLSTNSMDFYYFAELYRESSHSWRGIHDFRLGDRTLPFKHVRDEHGDRELTLSCPNLAGVRMIRIHNDCDAKVDLGVRYLNTSGYWRTIYYSWLPGQRSLLDIVTSNSYAAIFAESSDGSNVTWGGDAGDPLDKVYRFGSRLVRYRTIQFREKEGVYEYTMTCAVHNERALNSVAGEPVTSDRTEIRIVYRNFLYAYVPVWWAGFLPLDYRKYPHAILVAVHPTDSAKSYFADAGPARGVNRKSKKTRECPKRGQLCGVVRSAAYMIDDPNYQNYQSLIVDEPFDMVVQKMAEYRDRVNELRLDYSWSSLNCNSFVFSFLRKRLHKYLRPEPWDPGNDIYVLAWDEDVPGT